MPKTYLAIDQPDGSSEWLQIELDDDYSLIPHQTPIPRNLHHKKGIYFWFMRSNGYSHLSKYSKISCIESVFQRMINGEEYHLVYLGTAGVCRNGGGDLFCRLKWHLYNNHCCSSVLSGTLSTLRQGLGALLSDDLILPNTEERVNEFMRTFMRIFWITYNGYEDLIERDERFLIQALKPLLNIKNNPNSSKLAPGNSTLIYRSRRHLVIELTRRHLECDIKSEISTRNSITEKVNQKYKHQILTSNEKYTEFSVYQNQSIAEVIKGIPGLPTGRVTFQMFEAANPSHQILPTWKRTGTHKQNIYTYFSNVWSKSKSKRYEKVKQLMIEQNIGEIIVRVCADYETGKTFSENEIHANENLKAVYATNQNQLKLNKNFKVVIICSKGKNDEGLLQYNGRKIFFKAVSNPPTQYLPDDEIPDQKVTWRQYILDHQNPEILPLMAYQLYKRSIYKSLYNKFKNNLYILSAGWGLIKAEFRIPEYDITFSSKAKKDSIRKYNSPYYYDFNQLKVEPDDEILFIGSKGYHKLFFDITKHLDNRKIIYLYKNDKVQNLNDLPNNTFVYRYYKSNHKYTWYYDLAKKLLDSVIP